MAMKKGTMPPRYDKAFKEGAIRLVAEQKRSSIEVAKELGISPDTMRNWLKAAGIAPGAADRSSKEAQRMKELEAQVRDLKKQVAEKDEVISVLKKSVGILSTP
jgi:transposase